MKHAIPVEAKLRCPLSCSAGYIIVVQVVMEPSRKWVGGVDFRTFGRFLPSAVYLVNSLRACVHRNLVGWSARLRGAVRCVAPADLTQAT